MPSLSSSCSPWLMGWNAVALTSLQSLLLILSDWNNQHQLCLKVPGMASKNEMLPHLAVEARCSPSLAIFVGHLPALAKFAIVPFAICRWTCFRVPVWMHLKASTFVEAKFSNEADAKQRCLVLATVSRQSSTWQHDGKPRHTQVRCERVQFFDVLCAFDHLTGPGINSWKPWRWITVQCVAVQSKVTVLYIYIISFYFNILLIWYYNIL